MSISRVSEYPMSLRLFAAMQVEEEQEYQLQLVEYEVIEGWAPWMWRGCEAAEKLAYWVANGSCVQESLRLLQCGWCTRWWWFAMDLWLLVNPLVGRPKLTRWSQQFKAVAYVFVSMSDNLVTIIFLVLYIETICCHEYIWFALVIKPIKSFVTYICIVYCRYVYLSLSFG